MPGAQEAGGLPVALRHVQGEEAGVLQLIVDVWRRPELLSRLEENRPPPEDVEDVPLYESTSRCSFCPEGESPFWTVSSLKVHVRTA